MPDITLYFPLVNAVIAAAAALGGAFGGAALSDSRARKREAAARREDRKDALREIAVELTDSGIEWASAGMQYCLGKVALGMAKEPFSEKGLEDERRMEVAQSRHLRAFARFSLTASDSSLVALLDETRKAMQGMTPVTSPVVAGALRGEKPTSEQVIAVMDYFGSYRSQLEKLEPELAAVLAAPVSGGAAR